MQTIKKRGGKLLFVLLLAAGLLSGCKPPGPRALLKGKALLEAGDFPKAVEQLRTATTLLPTNALAFNYLGLALHQAGQPLDAEKAYLRALVLNHELVEVRYNLGCLWLSENKPEQAKAELTAFTLRRVNSVEGWLKLGTAQLRTHEPGGAERSFGEVLRLKPAEPEALTGMGVARLQRNRTTEAIQWLNKALKAQPDYAPALLDLAIVSHEQLNDKALALQQYRQYLALKPAPPNADAVQKIVQQLQQELTPPTAPAVSLPSNNFAQKTTAPVPTNPVNPTKSELQAAAPKPHAVIDPVKAVTTNINSRPAASFDIPKSNPPMASARAQPPVSAQPSSPLEVVSLPNEPVFKPAQDVPTASSPAATTPTNSAASAPPLQSAESKTPKRSLLQRFNPARLFTGDEKPATTSPPLQTSSSSSGAEAMLATAKDLDHAPRYPYRSPPKPEAGNRQEAERAFAQGVQAHKANRLPEAIQAYRRATQLDPAYFDAYYNLGLAAMESGSVQLALLTYESALAVRPESLDARYNFALALKQSNFPLDAANELQKLLSVYPNESRAHLALGNLYAQQLHDPAKAREHYLKVLENDPRNPQAGAIRYWLTDNPR